MSTPSNFSKTRLLNAWQCSKMLYLKTYHKDLEEVSSDTQAIFDTGHAVGDIAKKKYGTTDSVEIEYQHDMDALARETSALIEGGADYPIFEATFIREGVVVRVDVLMPDGDGWRVIEVKSGTSVKDVNFIDCAIQYWVLQESGLNISSIALAHVDNQFEYAGDNDYAGLLKEQDVTAEAIELQGEVALLVQKARDAVSGDCPDMPVGRHCENPYGCAFWSTCWPVDTDYPIEGIGGNKDKKAEWVNRGLKDVREIPADEITAAKQQRIHRVTCDGEAEIIPGAKETLESLPYPWYHLDFETAGPAIPIWKGSRPYKQEAVQWSIHIDDGSTDGALQDLQHEEFLDLTGNAPMRPLAEKMIECLGTEGTIFMYTAYERGVIKRLIELCPDLEAPLQAIIERLYDLAKVVEKHYYHPDMHGSWSIKKVTPAMVPGMDHADLEGINEGMAASNGYLEAVSPDVTDERKAELEDQLLRYCRFDTEAMVALVEFLRKN
jgi:hypothetical protein